MTGYVYPNLATRLLCLLALSCLSLSFSSLTQAQVGGTQPSRSYVPGEFVVTLKEQAAQTLSQEGLIQSFEGTLDRANVQSVEHLTTDQAIYKVKLSEDSVTTSAFQTLKNHEATRIVEPNYIYHSLNQGNSKAFIQEVADRIPEDPKFSKLWGLRNQGQEIGKQKGKVNADISAPQAWEKNHTGSDDIVVAVIDTGIDWDHPDLKANLYTNEDEIPNDGQDNDGNGYVDDIHGWNARGDNHESQDDRGHGTHCAGIIGAQGNNQRGVTGVNWNVSLMPLQFIGYFGGELEDAIEAIDYARKMDVDIMSNSWGGGGFSEQLKEAIIRAQKDGILFVAAAGNNENNNDQNPTYPANYKLDNVLTVAATDNRDQLASFSNYGKETVDLAAPGVDILSTVPDGGYEKKSGTSMATPYVAGAAALLMASRPELSYREVKSRLVNGTDTVTGLQEKVRSGRLNINDALDPKTEAK